MKSQPIVNTAPHPAECGSWANDGCSIDEATPALACAHSDPAYCVAAKGNIGKLYEDVTLPPYTVIFNPSVSAIKLWRSVEVLRAVETFLKGIPNKAEGKQRLIAVHGNRLILHLVFRKLSANVFESENEDFAKELAAVEGIARGVLQKISAEYTKSYSSSYPANLFKNLTKCKAIAASIA